MFSSPPSHTSSYNDVTDAVHIRTLLTTFESYRQDCMDNLVSIKDSIRETFRRHVNSLQKRQKCLLAYTEETHAKNIDHITTKIRELERLLKQDGVPTCEIVAGVSGVDSNVFAMAFHADNTSLNELIENFGEIRLSGDDNENITTTGKRIGDIDSIETCNAEPIDGLGIENLSLADTAIEDRTIQWLYRPPVNEDTTLLCTSSDMFSIEGSNDFFSDGLTDGHWIRKSSDTTRSSLHNENDCSNTLSTHNIELRTESYHKLSEDVVLSELTLHAERIIESSYTDYLMPSSMNDGDGADEQHNDVTTRMRVDSQSHNSLDVENLSRILDAPQYKYLLARSILKKLGTLKRKISMENVISEKKKTNS